MDTACQLLKILEAAGLQGDVILDPDTDQPVAIRILTEIPVDAAHLIRALKSALDVAEASSY
jgi:hypothetical protein